MSIVAPSGKINSWCERRGLSSNDPEKISKARQYLSKNNLTKYEKAAFFLSMSFSNVKD